MHEHTQDLRSRRLDACLNLRRIRDYRLHEQDHLALIEQYYISLNTPIALSCLILLRHGENEQLVKKTVDPSLYLDPQSFADDFAAVSFLSKNRFLKTGIDRKDVALKAFFQMEDACKGVNRSLQTRLSTGDIHPDDWYVINSHIRKIDKFLGPFDIDHMLDLCSWGPGVSLSIKGSDVSPSRKFDVERDITPDAYRLFGSILPKAYPMWVAIEKCRFVRGNRVITVPKNSKTDRTIAIEPGINSWIQLGIGKTIRRRLRSHGYNLDSDTKNQYGAYIGSIDDSVATIDFKSASDSISTSLVEFLLPPTWYTVLDAARSKYYTLNGKDFSYSSKFSTMGNGFTFELQSLIFVTLALAVCEYQGASDESVSIFGDDLVLPAQCVSQFDRLCNLYGFTMNTSKSFSSGYFRESCGSYWFNGHDVKPLYHKEALRSLKSVYRFANSLLLYAHRRNCYMSLDRRFKRIWHQTVRLVPKELTLFGPSSAGDACIHHNFDESLVARSNRGWEGFHFLGIPTIAVLKTVHSPGLLLARLRYTSKDSALKNRVSLRGKVRLTIKVMWTQRWYDFGSWSP